MMLPSFLVLYFCLIFGACASTSEENLGYEDHSDSNPLDEDDFIFTELEFSDMNPYPPYPHNIYPLFRVLFLHVAKSDERISQLLVSLLSKIGNAPFLNAIQAIVLLKFNRGDFYPYTPESFIPKVRVQEYNRRVYNPERDADVDSEDSTESSFDERTGNVYEEPCDEDCSNPPLQAGLIRGIPGIDFPDYCDIPISSFSCADKRIPGFYADLETGCQVFHICWPHHRESFLCPVGTIFNQAILACDYWYSSNCSLAPLYYYSSRWSSKYLAHTLVGKESFVDFLEEFRKETSSMPEEHSTKIKDAKLHAAIPDSFTTESPVVYKSLSPSTLKSQQPPLVTTHSFESKHDPTGDAGRTNKVWAPKSKFLPVKSKITIYSDSGETVDQEIVIIPSIKIVPAFKLYQKPLAIKTEKSVSEMLRDILKITESVKEETQKFITKFEIDKTRNKFHELMKGENSLDETDKPHETVTIKTIEKFIKTTPKRTPRKPLKPELHFPEIKQRFIVKPVAIESFLEKKGKTLPIVTPSTLLNPSELFSMLQK
ncbi:chitin-binding type-2 domain-containing protein [Trichonephila clavata]|uniref:Chitin-binding type-2 domain-containing protein n=1 Tax=Trichonephila clavata TaxID=2740835 RepID=A0A8X6LAB8_TRICU|nr:chitin-binding type-2 domain-containing protein [Trichonephila clavata]